MDEQPAERPEKHTERRHVETYPSPGVAPEMMDHPTIKPEPGGYAQSDDVDAGLVAMVGAAAVLLMVVLVLVLQAWYYGWAEDERAARSQTPLALLAMRADQDEQLHGYRWIDKSKQVVQVDIDQAMKQVVADETEKK